MDWEKKADNLLLLVADDWKSLRKVDVFRLFDSNDDYWWTSLLDRMADKRPDLLTEAKEVIAELLETNPGAYEYYSPAA